jgi:hypothetical protein
LFVRLADRPLLCKWGMTSQCRIGPLIDEHDPQCTMRNRPPQERMLPIDDAEYEALLRQEDPEARQPWAHAVAAFKRMGGNVPQAPPGAECWHLVHLYEALTHYAEGNKDEAHRAARHYTQSANLAAVHPVVHGLMRECPWVVLTLQARVFAAFGYDPANQFAPEREHDNCGFVPMNG